MCEPFIFPAQATQVFFSDDPGKAGWKVVLTSDVFITTTVETTALTAPRHVPLLPTVPTLNGAMTLSIEEHLLASANF
jgi:hypothetical protein